MRSTDARHLFAAVAALSVVASSLSAAVILPTGLAPGSQYQLIFVTADPSNATNPDINFYNTFVSNQAALGVISSGLPSGLTWTAVASTSAVDANANAPSGALPVYNTIGQQVTAPGVGIYTGALDNLVAYDQYGLFAGLADTSRVWTGSDFTGVGIPGFTLGGGGQAEVGQLALDGTWLEFTTLPKAAEVAFARPFYALSSVITVVPEPASLTLFAVGLALIALRALRSRRPSAR